MAYHNPFKVTVLAAALTAAGVATPAYALFDYQKGDLKISADTTVSAGIGWRASARDYRVVGEANALAAQAAGDNPTGVYQPDTSSFDNGDLNWKKGAPYTEVVKALLEVQMDYKNYGAFVRGRTFYDGQIMQGDGATDRPAYYPNPSNGHTLEPQQSTGSRGDILDAFIWGNWRIADRPLNVRLGKQVISWGEGLLYANGINTINPIDVNALLTPGSELKDALIPVESLYGSFSITDDLSVEAFYQFKWRKTQIPDCGTFFSTTDIVGAGCHAGFYAVGDAGYPNAQYTNLPRGADIDGSNNNQYGFALRYFIEAIQTEVAFYHIRYNSRLPVVSGTAADLTSATARGTIDFLANFQRDAALQAAFPGYANYSDWNANLLATDGSNEAAKTELLTTSLTNGAISLYNYLTGTVGLSAAAATAAATKVYEAFSTQGVLFLPYEQYNVEYPDDIKLWGFSFNSNIDFGLPGGETAVAGEISYRENQPLQIEDSVSLTGAIGLPSQSCADTGFDCFAKYGTGAYTPGYIREEFWQGEVSFIQFFDRILGADRWTAILDMAYDYSPIPSKDTLLLNSAYNATPTPAYGPLASPTGQRDYYPTPFSWGYKLRFSGDYNNVFAGVNLHPIISFSHDVKGVTPGPIGTFLQNRKALGLELEADYLNTYTMKVGYTDFFGAEPYNLLADRDFYSLSLSASF